MGKPQSDFLVEFKAAFRASIGEAVWIEGQGLHNKITLPFVALLRRGGFQQRGEWFEFGDIRTEFGNRLVIIEYESSAIAVHNLVKYWPFIRGEMSFEPSLPVVLCHFSDWGSYGSHRDLWHWVAGRMSGDAERLADFTGEQFDHGGKSPEHRQEGIASCIAWLKGRLSSGSDS